ncbi:hypothetical protein IW262DRAFT_1291249 [Armillaria fumosa]|nr:hypothetical protein IW262DRAFT_1291249 [Armillaria fumosa]
MSIVICHPSEPINIGKMPSGHNEAWLKEYRQMMGKVWHTCSQSWPGLGSYQDDPLVYAYFIFCTSSSKFGNYCWCWNLLVCQVAEPPVNSYTVADWYGDALTASTSQFIYISFGAAQLQFFSAEDPTFAPKVIWASHSKGLFNGQAAKQIDALAVYSIFLITAIDMRLRDFCESRLSSWGNLHILGLSSCIRLLLSVSEYERVDKTRRADVQGVNKLCQVQQTLLAFLLNLKL